MQIDSATCTGLLQDDDDRFVGLAPLQLAAPDGTAFPLGDLASLARRKQAGSGGDAVGDVAQLLAPPGRMDDAGARVAPAQLANQVRTPSAEHVLGVARSDGALGDVKCFVLALLMFRVGGRCAGHAGGARSHAYCIRL